MWIAGSIPRISQIAIARASAGACCLLFSLGATANQATSASSFVSDAGMWAAPVDEAPLFVTDSSNTGTLTSDVNFVAQSWRWSPGTNAWIAVLVRVQVLEAIGLVRVGGLYGP